MATWIDCHAHLDNLAADEQKAVITRAGQAGVATIINAADDEASCDRIAALVQQYPNIYGNVGIHPHNAKDVTDATYAHVAGLLDDKENKKIIAVGEIGLDFYYKHSEQHTQIEVFEQFMDLAIEKSLPIVVHQRDAEIQTIASLKKYSAKGLRGMIHCFTGTWDFARQCLDMGFYISFSGIVTFKKATAVQEVAQKVPADRLLIETDAPWLAPEPLRGKPNESAYMIHTAAKIAQLRGITGERLAESTKQNCLHLFGISS